MDVTPPNTTARTGVSRPKNAGLQTFFFFALIILVVGAAGFLGIAVWGPEKSVKSTSHLASDPPPPIPLPTLAASAETPEPSASMEPSPESPGGREAADEAASAAPGAADSSARPKRKNNRAPGGKRGPR